MLLGALRSGRIAGKYFKNKSREIGHTVTTAATTGISRDDPEDDGTDASDLLVRRNFDDGTGFVVSKGGVMTTSSSEARPRGTVVAATFNGMLRIRLRGFTINDDLTRGGVSSREICSDTSVWGIAGSLGVAEGLGFNRGAFLSFDSGLDFASVGI